MKIPYFFSWFHVLCLSMLIALAALIIARRRYITEKLTDRILLGFWITVTAFEIIKQICFSYSPLTDTWAYQWYTFPFQFCSSILYVLPVALFFKSKKLKDFIYCFMATYNLFAGIAVMLYPGDVFTSNPVINVQTMVHHGLMILSAVLIVATRRIELNPKTVLKGFPVFTVLISIAMIFNKVFASKPGLNLFYIDVEGCHLPILNLVSGNVPYVVFLIIYFIGFTLCAFVVMYLLKLPFVIAKNIEKRSQKHLDKA